MMDKQLNPAAPAASPPARMGPSVEALLCGLFERAQPALSDADLSDLVQHGESATMVVGGLAGLCMGLGAMLSCEAWPEVPAHAKSGSFQRPNDVADLLFLLSHVADHAHGLLQVAALADLARSMQQLEPPSGRDMRGDAAEAGGTAQRSRTGRAG